MGDGPDFKQGARVRDPGTLRLFHLRHDCCEACGATAGLEAHHVVPRSLLGDDFEGNLLMLCGGNCHGPLHRGDLAARERIGAAIERRPDIVSYVRSKLGADAGDLFLERRYLIGA